MSPRNEAKTKGHSSPNSEHLPVPEMPAKQHLFIAMPKRHRTLFFLGRGGGGNLLRDCELSGDRLCLGLYLRCQVAAVRFSSDPPLEVCGGGDALVQARPGSL